MFKIILTGLIVMLMLVGCTSDNGAGDDMHQGSVIVDTIMPEIGSIVVAGEYIGRMEPIQQVTVFPRVPGTVVSVYFGVGDTVNAGDVLFTLEATEITNSIASLEAQLEVQDATVRAAETGVALVGGSAMQSQILTASGAVNQAESAVSQSEQNVHQALIGIEQAQLGYDVAAQNLSDITVLYEAGIEARIMLDQAQAAYLNAGSALERAQSSHIIATTALNQARQALAQAREGHRILTGQASSENRRRAQDTLNQAQAARNTAYVGLQTAMDRLDDTSVRSPISGIIEMRSIEQHNMAAPGAPAFVISAQGSMAVTFRVPRNSLGHMELGDEITLFYENARHIGAITEIGTTVDISGLVTVRANIPDPPASLISGASVRISAEAQRALDILVVPLSAVHYDRGAPHVFVADGARARRIAVETGIFDAQNIQIISGLSSDDQIISTWSSRLSDGIEIEVANIGVGRAET